VPVQRKVVQKRRLIRLSPHHRKRSRFDYAIESALSFTLNGRVFQQNRRIADFVSRVGECLLFPKAADSCSGKAGPDRDGQTIWYAIASTPAKKLVETLYHLYYGPAAICRPAGRPAAINRKAHR
jgi:hypothetical protein